MRVLMLAYGTWGDVRPYVVLAQALQREGFDVLVLAAEEYCEWVQARGLAFAGLGVNVQEVLDSMLHVSDEGTGTNFIASARRYSSTVAWAMQVLGAGVLGVVREGDALLYVETGQSLFHGIVEKYRLRPIIVSLFPMIPTAQFPVFNLPEAPAWLPAHNWYNRMSGGVLRFATWQIVGRQGNKIRRQLGLPRIGWRRHRALLRDTPQLLLVSRHMLPAPKDWSPQIHLTGYLFDDDPTWQPPQALLDFLDRGEKPVYIGFGSMVEKDPAAMTRLIIDALRQANKRAVLLSGLAGIGGIDLPETVFLLDYAPHSWLFPRMAAVVHHGGAGTIAAGLRAGVPTIIVPLLGDQLFWGRHMFELGAGTRPLRRGKLTASSLAAAILEATTNTHISNRVLELSRLIQAEDGLGAAVDVVKKVLETV